MKNYKIIRVVTGEDILCHFVENGGDIYMYDPMVIVLKKHKTGELAIGLEQWLPIELISKNITRLLPTGVLSIFNPSESIIEYYENTLNQIKKMIEVKSNMDKMEQEGEDMERIFDALEESQGVILH